MSKSSYVEEAMNKIKGNKKTFILIVIISLLAVLLGSYAIYKNSNKDETANKIEKSEELEKKAEKKLKEAKKSGDKEEIAKAEKELKEAEEKTEEIKKEKTGNSSKMTSANTSKSTPTATKPSTSSSSGASSTKPAPKPKEKKQVWVVDKAAWTETVKEPIYSERNVWYASNADNSKQATFYSYEECDRWLDTVGEGMGGYQKTTEEYISGYNTRTINHPEEGHWEYR